MSKNTNPAAPETGKMPEKGDVYKCDVCSFEVTVNEDCGCSVPPELRCCDQPMTWIMPD